MKEAWQHWPWTTCFKKNIHLSEKDNPRETRLNQIKIKSIFLKKKINIKLGHQLP